MFNRLLLPALAATALAAQNFGMNVVHERREIITGTKGERVPENAVIPIRIGLRQSNLESGYDEVMDVSDPTSPNYGKHWTLEEVRAHFAPSDESIEAIKMWLIESGIDSELIGHSDDKAWIGINIPVKQAEALLGAEYYEHDAQDGSARIGCDEYSLPLEISRHVDYIKPGITLSPPLEKKTFTRRDLESLEKRDDEYNPQAVEGPPFRNPLGTSPVPSTPLVEPAGAGALPKDLRFCGSQITPDCIRALYDIPRGKFNTPENALGVAEFAPDEYNQKDLDNFFKAFAPYVPRGTHPALVSIDGGMAPTSLQNAGPESDIDFDLTISLTYPQSLVLYQVGPVSFNRFSNQQYEAEVTFLLPLLDAFDGSFCTSVDRQMGFDCGTTSITRVLSVSYGYGELFFGQPAVTRTCNEIMKLSLRGSTIVFSSGDYGVASVPSAISNGCINKSYNLNLGGKIFSPTFPVGCPYILAVGATQLYEDETVRDPESVLYQPGLGYPTATFSSAGGFSNYFSRPGYQHAAVQHYLDHYVPNYPTYIYNGFDLASGKSNVGENGGLYNRVGRAYPDVSANGANLTAYISGQLELSYGTSLSAPIWASIITLINEERTQIGKGPVGFVNPVLYAHPEAFTDITRGTNPGCGTKGFPAAPGWDPSTGLGTPKYPALLSIFKSL